MKSKLFWFGLMFLMACGFAAFLPQAKWAELVFALAVTGSIMLCFTAAGFLGFPMRGNADPKDIASGAAGLLTAASILSLLT